MDWAPLISPSRSWQDRDIAGIVNRAPVVYLGTVIATHPGFFWGHPGSLVEVEISKEINTNPYLRPPLDIYFYTFYGNFSAGQYDFRNSHPLAPYLPQAGDLALVFIEGPPFDPEERVFLVNDVIYQTPAGEMPKTTTLVKLKIEPGVPKPKSFSEFVHLVKDALLGPQLGRGEDERDSK